MSLLRPDERSERGARRRDASRRVPGFWPSHEPRPGARRRFLIEKISKLTFLRGHGRGRGGEGREGGTRRRLSRGGSKARARPPIKKQ